MGKAGDIATGTGETCDQADFDRSRDHHEYDRHGTRLSLHSRNDGRGVGEHRIWRRADQLCDVRPQCFGINGAPAFIDLDIAPLGPPQLSKHLPKRRETNLRIRITLFASHQHSNAPLPLGLLRARPQRPRRRAPEQRHELAPLHSITSSARASSLAGICRSNALAVVSLITNSNLLGCMTGSSAGLAPLRTLPV